MLSRTVVGGFAVGGVGVASVADDSLRFAAFDVFAGNFDRLGNYLILGKSTSGAGRHFGVNDRQVSSHGFDANVSAPALDAPDVG